MTPGCPHTEDTGVCSTCMRRAISRRARKIEREQTRTQFARAEQYTLATAALVICDALATKKRSQKWLAKQLDLSEARVSQMLAAESNLTLRSLARVADVLGYKIKLTFEEK